MQEEASHRVRARSGPRTQTPSSKTEKAETPRGRGTGPQGRQKRGARGCRLGLFPWPSSWPGAGVLSLQGHSKSFTCGGPAGPRGNRKPLPSCQGLGWAVRPAGSRNFCDDGQVLCVCCQIWSTSAACGSSSFQMW